MFEEIPYVNHFWCERERFFVASAASLPLLLLRNRSPRTVGPSQHRVVVIASELSESRNLLHAHNEIPPRHSASLHSGWNDGGGGFLPPE